MPNISLPAAISKAVRRSSEMGRPRTSAESLSRGDSPRASLDGRSNDNHKRGSILNTLNPRTGSTHSLKDLPAHLECVFESPPLIMHGNPSESSGALLSGRMVVSVTNAATINVSKFTLRLVAESSFKKPVASHCAACERQASELKEWKLVENSKTLAIGDHSYPFSHLLPGNLPQTTTTSLGKIEYKLLASCVLATGEELTLTTPVKISRALFPKPEKNSIRIFPPTKLSATITMPCIHYEIGNTPIQLTMSGIVDKDAKTRWRLRKLMWRIDETIKCISPACKHHSEKLGGEGKGILHEDSRTIGVQEMKQGWKTDFDFVDSTIVSATGKQVPSLGRIECEFVVAPKAKHLQSNNMNSPLGMSVTHVLTIELVVSEESIPSINGNRLNRMSTQTGSARVLRIQFPMDYTDRPGMGISWDEEQPPLYEDVPPSPPLYKTEVLEYTGPELPLDDMHSDDEGRASSSMEIPIDAVPAYSESAPVVASSSSTVPLQV